MSGEAIALDGFTELFLSSNRTLADRISKATPEQSSEFSFYEFFAGGGMARAGLGSRWKCLFANDFDHKKSAVYVDNWGHGTLKTKDVARIETSEVPGRPDLIWASFPCQDLSLAGMGAGLRGNRSGTFWPFWDLVKKFHKQGRGPHVLVLENVCGTLTSHEGQDFVAIAEALRALNYRFGALVIDAAAFVPQSRPRLFIIAVGEGAEIPGHLVRAGGTGRWHSEGLRTAFGRLPENTKEHWIWWELPDPPKRQSRFIDLLEDNPASVRWNTPEETEHLLSMMSPRNLEKVKEAKKSGDLLVGAIYKRTRRNENGKKVQRAEIRFDGLAGCLRTPAGGSSRQVVVIVKGNKVKSRLISSRETARLMGLPDEYKLPQNYNEAYHLTGDGVVVPVVRHIAANLLESIVAVNQ